MNSCLGLHFNRVNVVCRKKILWPPIIGTSSRPISLSSERPLHQLIRGPRKVHPPGKEVAMQLFFVRRPQPCAPSKWPHQVQTLTVFHGRSQREKHSVQILQALYENCMVFLYLACEGESTSSNECKTYSYLLTCLNYIYLISLNATFWLEGSCKKWVMNNAKCAG